MTSGASFAGNGSTLHSLFSSMEFLASALLFGGVIVVLCFELNRMKRSVVSKQKLAMTNGTMPSEDTEKRLPKLSERSAFWLPRLKAQSQLWHRILSVVRPQSIYLNGRRDKLGARVWTAAEEKRVMDEQIEIARRQRRGFAIYWPIWFALLIGAVLAYVVTRVPNYPVYEYHNVKVLRQLTDNDWWIEREDGETLWNGCHDFPNSSVIWPGYVMDKFRYQDFGKCKSILRSDLGVWWRRDPITKDVVAIDTKSQ